MKHVAVHTITVGNAALRDKSTGEEKRASTQRTIHAGEEVDGLDQAEIDRLTELGAIVPQEQAQAAARAKGAAAGADANADADAKAKADADAKAKAAAPARH